MKEKSIIPQINRCHEMFAGMVFKRQNITKLNLTKCIIMKRRVDYNQKPDA